MVCDGHDHVEIVEEGGITSDVCHHCVHIDREAHQCDHQENEGNNQLVDGEMVIKFGHTVQIPDDRESCETCPQDFDHVEVDLVSIIAEPVSKC